MTLHLLKCLCLLFFLSTVTLLTHLGTCFLLLESIQIPVCCKIFGNSPQKPEDFCIICKRKLIDINLSPRWQFFFSFSISALILHNAVFLITACGCAIYSLEFLSTQSQAPQDVPYRAKLRVLLASLLWATMATTNFENLGTSTFFIPGLAVFKNSLASIQWTFVYFISKHMLCSGDGLFFF